jgi:hypothetical protein
MNTSRALTGLAAACLVLLASRAHPAGGAVSIESVTISPASPGPGALCGLSVRLKNAGTHTATDFRFKAKIDGQDVAPYGIETYAVNVAPGSSDTITLHNFWTPAAPKASLTIEVSLAEGRWADVKQEGRTTTTTPIGPIEGLPVSATGSVRLSAK